MTASARALCGHPGDGEPVAALELMISHSARMPARKEVVDLTRPV